MHCPAPLFADTDHAGSSTPRITDAEVTPSVALGNTNAACITSARSGGTCSWHRAILSAPAQLRHRSQGEPAHHLKLDNRRLRVPIYLWGARKARRRARHRPAVRGRQRAARELDIAESALAVVELGGETPKDFGRGPRLVAAYALTTSRTSQRVQRDTIQRVPALGER
jgi:hypothetical protein